MGGTEPMDYPQIGLTAALLTFFTVIGIGVVSLTHEKTAADIARNEHLALVQRLSAVLPVGEYDNDPSADRLSLPPDPRLGTRAPSTAWLARREGRVVAVVLAPVARGGYSGDIHLLVGARLDGTLTGVRVTQHKETPGLGDPIEESKSDWIHRFTGKSLGNPAPSGWAVKKDGGAFDQFTGATITPRAVVGAVRSALEYVRDESPRLMQEKPDVRSSPD